MKKISLILLFLLGNLFFQTLWAKNNDTFSTEDFLKHKQLQELQAQKKQLSLEQRIQLQQKIKKQKHNYSKQLSKKLKNKK